MIIMYVLYGLDYKSIDLNENEAKKLHKALSKFIELRDALRKDF